MIRAIAIASESSDVVGTVDLDCTRDGLALTFVRVAPYAVSFAPTVPIVGRRAVVPYDRIERVWDDGETLRILMDAPRIPYKRLVLAHFTHDRTQDHRALARRRQRSQLVIAGGAALLAAVVVPLAAQASLVLGTFLGAAGVFGLVAGALWLAPALARTAYPHPEQSGADRRALFDELRGYLPLDAWEDFAPAPDGMLTARGRSVPPPVREMGGVGAFPAPARAANVLGSRGAIATTREDEEDDGAGWPLPGRTMALAVAAAFVGLLALSSALRLLRPPETAPLAARETDRPDSLPASAVPASTEAQRVEVPTGESCLCQTPTSVAFPVKVPRLTRLAEITRARADARRPSLDVEIAVVNNAAAPTGELKANVGFLHAMTPGQPAQRTQDRGVFYEGPLAGGAAIKWRVRGRGSSFLVEGLDEAPLDDGSLASPDAFAKLLDARTRSVRLHGAAMLARARDERAGPAIERLRTDARDNEAAFLSSIARAAAPLYACKLSMQAEDDGRVAVTACVMNTANEDAGPIDATLALSAGGTRSPVRPAVPGTSSAPVFRTTIAKSVRVPAKAGVIVRGTVDVSDVRDEVVGELELGVSGESLTK